MMDYEGAFKRYVELCRKIYNTGELENEEWDEHRACYRAISEHGIMALRRKVEAEKIAEHFKRVGKVCGW